MTDLISELATQTGIPLAVIVVALMWSYAWKLVALWKSARSNQPVWFVVLALVNTLGIFEILYIFLFSKINLEEKDSKEKKATKKRKR